MMKKKLFLLFSAYFFVLQPVFLWFLWWDNRFFILSLINLFFIATIALLSKEKKSDVYFEEKIEKVEYTYKVQKPNNSKPISHIWFFVISILFGSFLWFWIWDIAMHLHFLVSVLGWFILFIAFSIIFSFRTFKVWSSIVYMLVLIVLIVWSIVEMLNIRFSELKEDTTDTTTTTGTSTFVPVDADLTWDVMTDIISWLVEELDLSSRATFDDAIKYLIRSNDIDLISSANVKFNYIPYNHKDYPYYRTAYQYKMIWTDLNPSKNLMCETFVVMRGLVEWWEVKSAGDIKKTYWDYANNNDKIVSCKYGEFLTLKDIN